MRVIMALALMSSMSSMASLPSVVRAEDGKRDPLTVGTILKGKYTYDDTPPKTYHDWELRVKDRDGRKFKGTLVLTPQNGKTFTLLSS